MSRDYQAWPELLDGGRRQAENGLDRHPDGCLMGAKFEQIDMRLTQIDRGIDKLNYQHEEQGRILTALDSRHKGTEEDLKRFVFLALAAVFSLVANLLLSKH